MMYIRVSGFLVQMYEAPSTGSVKIGQSWWECGTFARAAPFCSYHLMLREILELRPEQLGRGGHSMSSDEHSYAKALELGPPLHL